jgi:hypothetical protein
VGTGTQGVSLALHLCYKAVRYLRLLGMVTWLSDSQSQGESKQNPEIGLLRDNGAVRTTPTCAMEALICLLPLELIVQCEARLAAHHLWSLGCWSFLHPNSGHSNILKWLEYSDPVFNEGRCNEVGF